MGGGMGQAAPQYSSNPQSLTVAPVATEELDDRMSAGMGGMAPAGSTSMTSYSQGPSMTSGGAPAQHQGSYMGGPMGGSQQMQLRQAQMMAMQQQQPQQQPAMTSMMAPQQRSLTMRRMSSSGMQAPPGPSPQYGNYQPY